MPTQAQLTKVHLLITQTGNAAHKKDIVAGFSAQRHTSSKDLEQAEITALIRHLEGLLPNAEAANKMRRKIISMAHEMGWWVKDATGKPILRNGKPVANMPDIDAWCLKQGGKKLQAYSFKQLPNIVTAFEQMKDKYLKQM